MCSSRSIELSSSATMSGSNGQLFSESCRRRLFAISVDKHRQSSKQKYIEYENFPETSQTSNVRAMWKCCSCSGLKQCNTNSLPTGLTLQPIGALDPSIVILSFMNPSSSVVLCGFVSSNLAQIVDIMKVLANFS